MSKEKKSHSPAPVENLKNLSKFGIDPEEVKPSHHWGVLRYDFGSGQIHQVEETAAKIALLTQAMVEYEFNGEPHSINQFTAAELLNPKRLNEDLDQLKGELTSTQKEIKELILFRDAVYPSKKLFGKR